MIRQRLPQQLCGAALIKKKKENILYAVMSEVVNPLPLEMLDPADEASADIIRVIIWKTKKNKEGKIVDALQEGYRYCKGIVEKGYKLCVQPARVDQYSDEEFKAMVKQFSTLNPLAIYVVDSWGTMNSEQVLHYVRLADTLLSNSVAIGYHGHNNMMQALDIAKDICALNLERTIILDSSVAGMGRGAGNLDSFHIAEYLNRNLKKEYRAPYFLYVEETYINPLRNQRPWGYSMPYYLTALYYCNPEFASYYAFELGLSPEVIQGILLGIPKEERIIYTRKKAKYYLKQYRKAQLNMVIIVPTCNRSAPIENLLSTSVMSLWKYGIDIVIYDSSSDTKTEAVTRNFQIDGYDNVIYEKYTGEFDGFSLDQKIITAYKDHLNYEYIWVIRDGLIPMIDIVYEKVLKLAQGKTECIVVDASFRNDGIHLQKKYTDPRSFFIENGIRITVLGALIFHRKTIETIIAHQPLNENTYSLWLVAAPLRELAVHSFSISLLIDDLFIYNVKRTPNSFWNQSGKALRQWTERWYQIIINLPEIYDEEKINALKIDMFDFHPFHLESLLRMRGNGGLNLSLIKKYKKYFSYVCNTSIWKFYFAALIPKNLAKTLTNHPEPKLTQGLHKLYHILRGDN